MLPALVMRLRGQSISQCGDINDGRIHHCEGILFAVEHSLTGNDASQGWPRNLLKPRSELRCIFGGNVVLNRWDDGAGTNQAT